MNKRIVGQSVGEMLGVSEFRAFRVKAKTTITGLYEYYHIRSLASNRGIVPVMSLLKFG